MTNRVVEFHNIIPIQNIPSVLTHGILSNVCAVNILHGDCSMAEIQDKRDMVQVPGGLKLHQYANLYFDARNPMMSKRREQAELLCVLIISVKVLACEGVVLSDQNASSDYVRFYPPEDLNKLPFEQIYSKDWRHSDMITYWRQKSRKCAEILVPNKVNPEYIRGAYVVNEEAQTKLLNTGFNKAVKINPDLFFR